LWLLFVLVRYLLSYIERRKDFRMFDIRVLRLVFGPDRKKEKGSGVA
jgi:hypothetical protein